MIKLLTILCLLFLLPTVSALGMEKVEFFEVEQGSTQTIVIDVYTAPTESENEFKYEILADNQEIHDWISISPEQFIMAPGEQRQAISVTLIVPFNAELGDRNGELKFAGSRVSGTGTIGYTVATKSVIHFKVVKEGAKKKIDFISMNANPYILPNEIAKFETLIKNTGNVPTNFYVSLIIEDKNTYEEIFSVDTAPMTLNVGLSEDVVLYWQPEQEGNYTGCFKIIFDDSVDEITSTTIKSDSFLVIVTNQAPTDTSNGFSFPKIDPLIIIGIICVFIALFLVRATLKIKPDADIENKIELETEDETKSKIEDESKDPPENDN